MFDEYDILTKIPKNTPYSSIEITDYLQGLTKRKVCGKCVRLRLEFFALIGKIIKEPNGKFTIPNNNS